ncbi:hypothetical protein GDO81_002160 [Engystomops pustulosus]|uniref:Tantalus-like domain-containing protein n=2 Tax=Engystomops pustulosus TaxID=76066 RepID=A0AAV7DIR3_ENGPU|nr:hypothetical protein GDO81_002160 [Engystomops pustulosus]KAG8597076.1 hypothetical protein GDO81_002160 [Engystomops pustulosus]KAG8597077.1 hypothetical protein GDO81_002160 [Engystomops pustulosus]KAG8597078.1 hypothetical protein GDO81_002160 [Engystomops pustulosus]
MLELDVLEHRPLNSLEPSVSRTVTHTWPVLHVPFIHELRIGPDPILDPGNLGQVAVQVNVAEAPFTLTKDFKDTTIIPKPEPVFCAITKGTDELFIVNSAVMLDAVEKVTPMEICDCAQSMTLRESGESTGLQIREDFLEIPNGLADELHMKDGLTLSDPIAKMNNKTAGMEVMGTGAVLQSGQSEKVGNLLNDPKGDKSSGLEISDSAKMITEMGSLAASKFHLIDKSPEGPLHDECTVYSLPSGHQCTVYSTSYSVKCLEAEHSPCTSNPRTADFPGCPTSFSKTSTCKKPGFVYKNEVPSETCPPEIAELGTANDMTKENVATDRNSVSVESIQQEIIDERQSNENSITYPSAADSAETPHSRLEDTNVDTLKDGLLLCEKSAGNLGNDHPFKPNLQPCFEKSSGAKALDTEECSDAPDCHECRCANTLGHCSDPIQLTNPCEKPSYPTCTRTSVSVDRIETLFIASCSRDLERESKEHLSKSSVSPAEEFDRNERTTEPDVNTRGQSVETEETECAIPQTMKIRESEGTGELVIKPAKGFCDMVQAVTNNPATSHQSVVHCHYLVDSELPKPKLKSTNAALCDFSSCDEAISTAMQSDLATVKDTEMDSHYLKVPSRTAGYSTDETPSYALVPYMNIWNFLTYPEVNSPFSRPEPNNKIESQELKKDGLEDSVTEGYLFRSEISIKASCMPKNSQGDINYSRSGDRYNNEPDSSSKMQTLAQDVEISADSLSGHAEGHSIKANLLQMSALSQQEDPSQINSVSLCDSCIDVNVPNKLPQMVHVRHADDRLQSNQTNVSFQMGKHMPGLSLSNEHLHDCSTSFPTSLQSSTISTAEGKNLVKCPSEVPLDNFQIHNAYCAEPSVLIVDDLKKSLSLKQRHRKTPKEPSASDLVESIRISAQKVPGSKQSAQTLALSKGDRPLSLHMEKCLTSEPKTPPLKAVVTTKTMKVKSHRNKFYSEIKIPEQLPKEIPRQSVSCHMMGGISGRGKNYNLRPAPQSLSCDMSQEAKRPKISDGIIVRSCKMNCVDKFSLHSEDRVSQLGQAAKRKDPPGAISSRSLLDTNIFAKRQPNRKCKRFTSQESMPINTETRNAKTSSALKIHSNNINVKYRPPSEKHVEFNLTSKPHFSHMTRRGAGFQKRTSLLKCTQDQRTLNKLSRIANRLTAPSKSTPFSSDMKVIPFRGVKIQARKLLTVFSCVNMRMNSQPWQIWQENVCLMPIRDRHVSQSMTLYPKTFFSSLGDALSLKASDNLTFPVSFHVNLDPNCLSDFLKFNPPDFILGSTQPSATSSELSEWTLSLFLSSRVPTDTDGVHLLTQWSPQFRAVTSSSESSHMWRSFGKSGCSMLGLHTILALSSPGCYRLWTRRRNLGSRIPTIQKLSVTQFAHGLKGSPQLSRSTDQFSSLAFSLGRILSTWSQHGLSALSSDCANTHPNCSVWLPTQNSNRIRSPKKLVYVPQLPLNTVPQLNTNSLPVQNLNHMLKSWICDQEDFRLPFSLSIQHADDPKPLVWLPSQSKKDVEFTSHPIKPEDDHKHTIFIVKEKLISHHSSPQQNILERPLCVSALKKDSKPVINFSLQKDPTIILDSRCDVSIKENASVDTLCPKGQAHHIEQRKEIIVSCTESQNKDQGNEKGSFERRPQRVSQIKIRKTIPKPDPNLTPMGLPKPKRVNKKEFSLEDIYTNKNYKSPPPARSLETIFEEPKEKNGVLISVSQQKRKRILEFRDCTVPRLKRPKGRVKVMTSCKRGRKAAMEGVQLDALLIQKLMDLENCLLEEEAMERSSAASEIPC